MAIGGRRPLRHCYRLRDRWVGQAAGCFRGEGRVGEPPGRKLANVVLLTRHKRGESYGQVTPGHQR